LEEFFQKLERLFFKYSFISDFEKEFVYFSEKNQYFSNQAKIAPRMAGNKKLHFRGKFFQKP
jgi:hypothetical protein